MSVELAKRLGFSPEELEHIRHAAILHDIGKALNHEIEGSHVQIGVDILKKYKKQQMSDTGGN